MIHPVEHALSHSKFLVAFFGAISLAGSSLVSGIRGTRRDLISMNHTGCGPFGTCNERSFCTESGCKCKDGFKNPPYCEDRNECLEMTPPPCNFSGAVCVDEDPHLDGTQGGKYHCACRTKEGWVDGPNPNEFGPTSCEDTRQVVQCPNNYYESSGDSFCESLLSVDQPCSYGEECCCGTCSASVLCYCYGGHFQCLYTEACFFLSCCSEEQEAIWDSLIGTTQCYPNATDIILEDYPGMDVSCLLEDEWDPPADYCYYGNINRVQIYYNATTGLVSRPPRVG